ncbi:cell wall metabolism sensor histidine kinase WalK [Alicyclobacillus tolerans]|uniref:sensor histidine kinase n=1 Tax=Alicyclobacillus tolerans TaxID=90970 RepID=UPI001F25CBD9|nr:ATP-binding protein [Alicyclobacillus tolerans]MCF8565677.1 cell wall metabolism sensor histidine kinase WalK [Alicyclobacillus tolerans]
MWRSIRVKFVAVSLLLILFSVQLIGAYFVRALTASLIRNETQAVESQALLLATIAAPEMVAAASGKGQSPFTSILSSFPQFFNGSVYLLNSDGVVVDTSAGTALIGQKRIDSVATQALVGHSKAVAVRFDPMTSQHLLVVAVPMNNQNHFLGIVEYVVPIQNTYTTVREVTTIFYTGSAVALMLTALLGIVLSRTITAPVLDVTRQARTMAAGDFSRRVAVHSDDEFGELGVAINDLTDKLEDAIAANLRERERLQAVIKYMGDGVIAYDAGFRPTFSNDAAIRLLPKGPEDLPGSARLLGLIPKPGQEPQHERSFLRMVKDALVHVHVTSIVDQGSLEGYVALLRDVTEQEKLNQSRRDFVANVSHELKTPLTSMKTYIEALQDEAGDDPETREQFLRVLEQETNRMVRLTRDLLQLSGLETKTDAYSETVIDVADWLEQTVRRFQLQAQAQSLSMKLDCPKTARIKGDRDLLDRVIDNLLSNALKYTAAGGSIEIATRVRRETVEIRVSDTGIGIPKDDLPHVFERFYRVDKGRSRQRGGSGLGLALAREITERHGGTISMASELNKGTVVTVTLPLAEVAVQ